MPVFCRHNRFEANCPICSREKAAANPRPSPSSRVRPSPSGGQRSASGSRRSQTGLRTRRLARDAEDGYRCQLIPGVKATADADRLARSLAAAAVRLEFPGPHESVAAEPDLEQALWLAFLLALVGPGDPDGQAALVAASPAWSAGGAPAQLGEAGARTTAAYRSWAQRAGSQAAAFAGEAGWTPVRRFSRIYERLALPGLGRAERFELLVTVGAAGLAPLQAGSLHLGGEDATTQAAKRALVSGDVVLLDRRAAALADAAQIPLAALDRGLQNWNARGSREPGPDDGDPAALPRIRAAFGL